MFYILGWFRSKKNERILWFLLRRCHPPQRLKTTDGCPLHAFREEGEHRLDPGQLPTGFHAWEFLLRQGSGEARDTREEEWSTYWGEPL